MDTLPYELFADILKHVKQNEVLNIIESSKLPRMFCYLLQVYSIRNYNHVPNEKICLVKISTQINDLIDENMFEKNKFRKLYLPSILRYLNILGGDKSFSNLNLITLPKKLKTFIFHLDEYYNISMLNVKELLTTTFPIGCPLKLEKICINESYVKDSDISNLPYTLKYLDLRKTNCGQISTLPPRLETLLLHLFYSYELPKLPSTMKTIAISSAFDKNWNEIYNSNITRLIYTIDDVSDYSFSENFYLTDDRILVNKFTKIKYFHVVRIVNNIFSLRSFPPNVIKLIAKRYEINYTLPLTVKKLHCLKYNSKNENNMTTLIYEYHSHEIKQKYPHLTSLDIKQNNIVADFPLHLVKLTIRNYSYPANISALTKLKVLKIYNQQFKSDLSFIPQYLIYLKLHWNAIHTLIFESGDLPYLKKLVTNCRVTNLCFLKSLQYLICLKSCIIPKHVKYITLI